MSEKINETEVEKVSPELDPDEKLEFKERYEIPADKYKGWLSNI